jgi:DNA-binding MarR family transcriptional regulator
MAKKREELLQSLMEKIGTVMKSIHAKHGFPFGELKLSRPEVMLLFFISRKSGGVSSKDLTSFLHVTSGAITQFIDGLEEKKLVKRDEDPKDRRILRISLTETAKNEFTVFKKNYYRSVSPLFRRLDEKEIKQFIGLLDKIDIGTDESLHHCDNQL